MLAIGLSLVFMIAEAIGGYLAHSIAIFSDAAHLLTDIAGFIIALIATLAAKSPGTKHMTYGLARAEVFGALASVLSLWVITAILFYAAMIRAIKWFNNTAEDVDGLLMFIVACFGVLVNIALGCIFHEDHGGSFHPGHSHDHAHDTESDEHHHGHGHSHKSSHKESTSTEKQPLLKTSGNPSSYQSQEETDHHDHGHEHKHHDHDHEQHDHEDGHHEHDHGHDHGHDKHASSHDSHKFDHQSSHSGHHKHGHKDSHHGHGHTSVEPTDVNIEAAYLHVLTDLIQSVGVAIAGLLLWLFPHWQIIDPLCTFIFSVVALYSTVPLIRRVFMILFEGIPAHVDWEAVMERFEAIKGVEDVHDLHIWSISSNSISLTCHIRATDPQRALYDAHEICRSMGIDHATVQVHDAADQAFCYSQVCEGENETDSEKSDTPGTGDLESGSIKKRKQCVDNKVPGKKVVCQASK